MIPSLSSLTRFHIFTHTGHRTQDSLSTFSHILTLLVHIYTYRTYIYIYILYDPLTLTNTDTTQYQCQAGQVLVQQSYVYQ
jgi:hypothetical protein